MIKEVVKQIFMVQNGTATNKKSFDVSFFWINLKFSAPEAI